MYTPKFRDFDSYLGLTSNRRRYDESRYDYEGRGTGERLGRYRVDEGLGRAWRDKVTVGGRSVRIGDFTAFVVYEILKAVDGRAADEFTFCQLQDPFTEPGPVQVAGNTWNTLRNMARDMFGDANPDAVIADFMNDMSGRSFGPLAMELSRGLTATLNRVLREVGTGTQDGNAVKMAIRAVQRYCNAPRRLGLIKRYPTLGAHWPKPEFDPGDYED